MSASNLSASQLRALRLADDAPLGLVRLSESFHGLPDRSERVQSQSLRILARRGLVEERRESFGCRVFITPRGRAELADVDRARAVLEVQHDLFADGGAA